MSEWISVEDRLPEHPEDQPYWCHVVPNPSVIGFDGEAVSIQFVPYQRAVKAFRRRNGEIAFNCGAAEMVTHWMPLPAPPEQA